MLRLRFTHLGLAVLFLGTFCALSSAATLVVGAPGVPCPNAHYNTIGAAISAAASGDVIAICPALYPEQVTINKPLKLKGLSVDGANRVLIQPATLSEVNGYESVVSVVNTTNVSIENLAMDASNSTVTGCSPMLSVVHFFNSSGGVYRSAISGAQIQDPASCPGAFPGNGFGVLVDSDGTVSGPFNVAVDQNSIHNYTKDGVFALGPAYGVSPVPVNVEVADNAIAGIGPASGALQFGVYLIGASGRISGNMINEGTCGALDSNDCYNLRSEGVTLRDAVEGTVVDGNFITNAQSGIYLNMGTKFRITNNVIRNIDALDGMDVFGLTDTLFAGNVISDAVPVDNESCGIWENSGTGISGNTFINNTVNDAYCGVAYVTADHVVSGTYFNTLYTNVNTDGTVPNPVEPAVSAGLRRAAHMLRTSE
jgi:nitrous oxidase accessory protein NosD